MSSSSFRPASIVRLIIVVTLILPAPRASAHQLTFTPFKASGIYELGEKAGWTVTLPKGQASSGGFNYSIKKNQLDIVKTGVINLTSGSAVIEAALSEPGMLYVEVGARVPPVQLGAAIAPEELRPSVARPADFDAFWDGKLKALSNVPIDPVLAAAPTGKASTDKASVELYTVKLASLGSHVQGYLAKPSHAGKFPALVIFEGAGVRALQPDGVTDRAAQGWLAFDVDSHDIPPSQADIPENFQTIGNSSRETSYFLNMYLRDLRALDYISSRPDWDGKTIVVTGVSMGGQQSFVTAALNPKVTAVIANEPAGADSNGDLHGRKAGFPWPSGGAEVMQTALYFDTVNFASRIKAPVLASIGFIDTTTPPVGIWIALNQISAPKEVVPMIESEHAHLTPEKQGTYNSRSEEVLDAVLNGGQFKANDRVSR